MEYLNQHRFKLFAVLLLCTLAALGWTDAAAVGAVFMVGDIENSKGFDVLVKALGDHAGALKTFMDRVEEREKANIDRLREIEQSWTNGGPARRTAETPTGPVKSPNC